jgi:RNA 3'-terminal phosphate cyclase (ATP)/RNA 3'-terminal phosphate cyclase (GTP)
MLTIDGSYGEAGGQILRTALGLAVLTQTPIKVINIRAKRVQPGLRPQHLEGLRAVVQLCNGKVKGDRIGSTEIEFFPGQIAKRQLEIVIPTAGSIGLILQSLQLACVHAESNINIVINGGADFGSWAPPIPWLQNVLLPLLKKMGYTIEIKSLRSGFYPKGGAKTEIKITPAQKLKPIVLTKQGEIKSIKGLSIAAQQLRLRNVAERQAESASNVIEKQLGFKAQIEIKYVEALNPGSGLVLWLQTENTVIGSSAIGQIGITAENVGQRAAKDLINDFETDACLDRHAADQILPFLALAEGQSEITIPELTSHARTNMWVIEQFLKTKFFIKGKKPVKVICNGYGL